MKSIATAEEIRRFLTVSDDHYSDYGSGNDDGSGYGCGNGLDEGFYNCSGYGFGDSDGPGDSYCGRLRKIEGMDTHVIDGFTYVIHSIHRNIALVSIVCDDLTLKQAYVAKVGSSFMRGETPRMAVEYATKKDMMKRPLEERIDFFVEAHPDLHTPYGDLFMWHHILTGSYEFEEWWKAHNYKPDDSITVWAFIKMTKDNYRGDTFRMIAKRYREKRRQTNKGGRR